MWTDKYIGIPFKEAGRDINEGFDCFGLAKYVYKKELNADLPDYNVFYRKTNDKLLKKQVIDNLVSAIENADDEWFDIKTLDNKPRDYDGVLIKIQGHVIHIGIYVNPNMILHCYDGTDVVLEKIHPKWTNNVEKIIRWKNLI